MSHPTRRRYSRPPSRVAVYVAARTGLQPGSVEQLIHGHSPIQQRFEALVEAAVALDDRQLLVRLTAGLQAILDGRPLPEFSDALICQIQMADLDEDQAEARYLAERSREALRAWRDSMRLQHLTTGDALRAIDRHLEITGA